MSETGRRPRLLLVTTVPITIEAFFLPLVHRLREEGWEIHGMAAGIGSSPVAAELDAVVDAPWTRNPVRSAMRGGAAVRAIRRAVTAKGYDVVHVHTPVAGWLTRFSLRGRGAAGPAVVYSAHGFHFHPEGRPWTNAAAFALEWLAARWTDVLVVTNAEDLDGARRLPIDFARIVHVPGVGVDTDYLHPDAIGPEEAATVRAELGIPPDAPLILCIGELNRNKDQATLVRALPRMTHVDAHLALRGSGPKEGDLRRLAARLGVAHRTHILATRADLRPLIRAATAVALVSRREGLPRSLMEAMSLGVPAVGTAIRGIRELLADGAGLLAAPGDATAVASALDHVIAHPAEARSRAARARDRVVARYALPQALDLHLRIYNSLLEARSGARRGP